jgi:GcrA cell cycle regulator
LPPLPVTAVHDAAEGAAVPEPVRAAAPPPVVARSPVLRPVAAPRSRTVNCCWPIGEPGTRSFRFCDSEALSGKPYCGAHAQLAYVKVRDRRDEAAA